MIGRTPNPTSGEPASQPVGRVALFGDVGGHLGSFRAQLIKLGCDPGSGHIPKDLTIIQTGDLVHRGPDSDGCLRLVDRFIEASKGCGTGRWIQLAGNHEGHEIGGPMMAGFEDDVSPAGQETLRRWWRNGDLRIAAGIESVEFGPMLAVHGGVSPWLHEALGSLELPETVKILNSTVGQPSIVFNPGIMLGTRDVAVGPVWAQATFEVYLPWLMSGEAPYGQIHGHSTPVGWSKNNQPTWRREVPDEVRGSLVRTDDDTRHSHFQIAGHRFIAIDPGHGRRPVERWGPLMLNGAVTV